jgi:hypothetical protein
MQLTDAMDDVFEIVCDILHKYLPEEYDQLRVSCKILPLNHRLATYPFAGFVLNIQVCTDGHIDEKDDTICVVIPFGEHTGGQLVLHEMGLVLDLQEGDVLIFPSYRLTHFNLHFSGVRGSIVMHSDRDIKSWTVDRNGWDRHMVVKM